jgi:hypothetical protein
VMPAYEGSPILAKAVASGLIGGSLVAGLPPLDPFGCNAPCVRGLASVVR